MGENTRTFYICDVCSDSFERDHKPEGWEYVFYGQSWQSGSHKGELNKKFLACDKCLNKGSPLFRKLLSIFNPRRQESKE